MTECLHDNCKKEVFDGGDKCIFHCEKDNWFEVKDGEKKWDENLIKIFWKEIRSKVKKESEQKHVFHDFSYFIFPEFDLPFYYQNDALSGLNTFEIDETKPIKIYRTLKDYNFWYKSEKMIFDRMVIFSNARFLGNTYFTKSFFKNRVDFTMSKFLETVDFQENNFFGHVSFWNATFMNHANFSDVNFCDEVNFMYSVFSNITNFINTTFYKKTNFNSSTFSDKHDTKFFNAKFCNLKSEGCKPNITFQNIIFSERFLFESIDLSQVSFLNSNLVKVQFENCTFWKNSEDEVIFDESILNEKIKNKEDLERSEFKKIERIYVQLQETFAKNLEVADSFNFAEGRVNVAKRRIEKFYNKKDQREQKEFLYAEMKKRYDDLKLHNYADKYYVKEFNEKKKYFWLFFYKWLSRYNTEPTLAFIYLINIFLLFWIIYEINLGDLSESLHYSFTSSIPLLKLPVEIKNLDRLMVVSYYVQKILSTIVWTLLILSIRRKFKR